MQNNWTHFTVHLLDHKTILQMANVWFLPMWDPRIQGIEERTQNFVSNLFSTCEIKNKNIMFVLHSFSRFHNPKLIRLYVSASKFGRIPQQEANIDEEGNRFRSDFSTFLTKLVSGLSDRRDQEEMNIMNTKNWIMFQSKWFNIF